MQSYSAGVPPEAPGALAITRKLSESLPYLLDHQRMKYLYSTTQIEEDVLEFWKNALCVYCEERYCFNVSDIRNAFTVSFRGDIGDYVHVRPTTFETAFRQLLTA